MDTWNPSQYNKFREEREQPYFDLLALIRHAANMRVVDLGCGTGTLTRALHHRLHARETVGIDRSGRMLDQAKAYDGNGLRFEVGTIESFSGRGEYDLIFSNAAFHWINDHPRLIASLAEALTSCGQLAFQVPAMHDDPSHTVAEEPVTAAPFRNAFNGWHRPQPVLSPQEYASVLHGVGFASQRVALIVYPHVLSCRDDVVEWMKGTLLTEYERRLPYDLFTRFLAEYRARLLQRIDDTRPFFFPFKRILCWAQKGS